MKTSVTATSNSEGIEISFNAIRVGAALYETSNPRAIVLNVTRDGGQFIFADLVDIMTANELQDDIGFAPPYELIMNEGKFTIDGFLVEELTAALGLLFVVEDLGDILNEYRPE